MAKRTTPKSQDDKLRKQVRKEVRFQLVSLLANGPDHILKHATPEERRYIHNPAERGE
jgi:hypothetical protein